MTDSTEYPDSEVKTPYEGDPDCPECVRDGKPCEWHDPDWN